ncbi:MAG TPA: peptidoglycan-binding domain-containing protein, partial [Blastocatellia bacterium]|nr:peptidoglycan-binding domain-containing protein [Blastocatellia bacterium]
MRNQFTLPRRQPQSEPMGNPSPYRSRSSSGRNHPDYVRWLQRSLGRVLNMRVPTDGLLGLRTRKAIREFQRRMGIPSDGIVSARTESALIQANRRSQPRRMRSTWRQPLGVQFESFGSIEGETSPATSAAKGCRKDRCTKEYVRWVQRSLNKALGLRLTEDGNQGRATWSAIKRFQASKGLKPDATMGPMTEQALVAAGASAPPQPKEMPCGPTKPQELVKLLNKYRGDIPVHFLLGWIQVESGLRIDSSTYLCERGYFQVHPEQSQDHGFDHDRISYDHDYSVQCGMVLVRGMVKAIEQLAKKYGFSKNSDLFWGLVKLYHWIPSAPAKILADMHARGVKPASWAVVADFAVAPANRSRLKKALSGFDPPDGINNANKTFKAVSAWQKKLAADSSLSKEFAVAYESPATVSAPPLIKSETTPAAQTLYVKIPLGSEAPAKAMTGIFIPENFQAKP